MTRLRYGSLMAVFLTTSICSSIAPAQEPAKGGAAAGHPGPFLLTPADLNWVAGPPLLPPGAQMAAIEGDLKASGPFTVRLKFPAGYKIPPHWHPAKAHVTVISGTFNMGMGDVLDPARSTALPAGSLAVMPATLHHFGWTHEETVIQAQGMGPWGINYINPADDPRKK